MSLTVLGRIGNSKFGGQRRGRREQLAPMLQRSDADYLQFRVGQRCRDSEMMDVVVGERLGVLPEPETSQPIPDVHGRAPD